MAGIEKATQAKLLIAEGKEIREACKEVGLTPSAYYYYLSKMKKIRKTPRHRAKPSVTEITISQPVSGGKIIAFYGYPADVAEAVRSLV